MIVSDGNDRRRLERSIRRIRHAELRRGFGIVFLEAMACGVPVIGSKLDGSREALLDGQLGRLVDPNIPGELVEAITDILTMACVGNEMIRSRFSMSRILDREWMIQSVP